MEPKILIIGSGGHARETADILRAQHHAGGAGTLVGMIDEDPASHGSVKNGVPVLGDWSWFEGVDRSDCAVITAVGRPSLSRQLSETARALGLSFVSAVSPLAYVSDTAKLGAGVIVFPFAFVSTGAELGDHCTLNVGASVSHDCRVGRYVNVNPGARLAGGVVVGDGCYIGMGASILPYCSIGDGSVVGGGALVNHDVMPGTTAVGVPARTLAKRGFQP